jgi:hypothetical protein
LQVVHAVESCVVVCERHEVCRELSGPNATEAVSEGDRTMTVATVQLEEFPLRRRLAARRRCTHLVGRREHVRRHGRVGLRERVGDLRVAERAPAHAELLAHHVAIDTRLLLAVEAERTADDRTAQTERQPASVGVPAVAEPLAIHERHACVACERRQEVRLPQLLGERPTLLARVLEQYHQLIDPTRTPRIACHHERLAVRTHQFTYSKPP